MKSDLENRFYVYVYIDPRNYQDFYYGKGQGNRKDAHLDDNSDTEKAKTLKAIKSEGLMPIIRFVARNLTETEALLIEKTLIWKLGKSLTNISSGHFSGNFRPHNTLHKKLYGFDYKNALYYVNVGEGEARNWDDCYKYGFLSAGQNWVNFGSKIYSLKVGDIVAAYLKGCGYVGIGCVISAAVPANQFLHKGKALSAYDLVRPEMLDISAGEKEGEHIVGIDWVKAVPRQNAIKAPKALYYTTQLIVASMANQQPTVEMLEREFNVSFEALLLPLASGDA